MNDPEEDALAKAYNRGLALEKSGVDPALASGTFVTTVTDVVGFFVFLGLASVVLL